MSRLPVSFHSLVWPRVAALALMGVAVAGCSNTSRFDTPYASSQAPRQSEVTGSISPRPTQKVVARPLPTPSRPTASRPATVSSGGYASGSQGLGAYRPGERSVDRDVTGSIQAPTGHWTWDGGSPVTVGYGETVETIARRHGVPVNALLETNGVTNPSAIQPGQRLVIPRYVSGSAPQYAARQQAAPQVAAPLVPASSENVHIVTPGESLIGISRRYRMSLSALARANNIPPNTRLNVGDRITVPGGRQSAARPVQTQTPARVAVAAPRLTQPRTIEITRPATVPTQNARLATQQNPAPEATTARAEAVGGLPSFRWPVHGRVIAGFGARPNGVQNDGINLAVPEGTPVKAAGDGVVAYAGNELKGYGNLVLIRHADGYVSAYANASELLVKRGDAIKRGQVIAHAGQTGNVTSPQLHFEIRKGSTPVDPTKYLSGS